jgi:hypothetical protein
LLVSAALALCLVCLACSFLSHFTTLLVIRFLQCASQLSKDQLLARDGGRWWRLKCTQVFCGDGGRCWFSALGLDSCCCCRSRRESGDKRFGGNRRDQTFPKIIDSRTGKPVEVPEFHF